MLKECIEHLRKQSAPIFDILIIDNCSTDVTYDYIKEYTYDEKVFYIKTKKMSAEQVDLTTE